MKNLAGGGHRRGQGNGRAWARRPGFTGFHWKRGLRGGRGVRVNFPRSGSPIVTAVEFNERGLKVAEHAPRYVTAATYRTLYSGFDALGRFGTKVVERDAALFAAGGSGETTLTTDYRYSGFKTSITVHRPVGQSDLIMSRTTDARGKLIETRQEVSTPSPHEILTRYLSDPAGAVTHIVDTSGNVLVATYDDLGRKTRLDDPDRGTWTWLWDGLGRVTKQTDARGIYTRSEYDGIGRLERRFVKSPADAQEMLDASWYYDPEEYPGGPRQRGVVSRVENSDGFIRDYGYDSLFRPYKVTTKLPAFDSQQTFGLRQFVMEYAYDRNHGRQKAVRYPDGAIVGFDYGARGHLLGETELTNATGTRGTQYSRVSSMSPRGQVTEQVFGNCAVDVAQYEASSGLPTFMSALRPGVARAAGAACPQATQAIRQVEYGYDHLLNLKQQRKNFTGVQATEMYGYDDLQRLLSSSRTWVGSGLPTTVDNDSYAYDDLGNIRSKSDFSVDEVPAALQQQYETPYTYGASGRALRLAGPHAVLSVVKKDGTTVAEFEYDSNGNMTSGDGRRVTFDALDRPTQVVQGSVITDFSYAPDGARYRQKTTGPSGFGPKTVYYIDKDYELEVWTTSPVVVVKKAYAGATVLYQRDASPREARYLHLDRLGSTDAVTSSTKDASGAETATELSVDAHGYDPFGKPRARSWTASGERLHPSGGLGATTDRGFTGHEHLDNLYLVHMNGRVYDYRLGRFLSVDPIISNPADSQSMNPYSYIGNNPLSGTDPTGYAEVKVNACGGTHTDKCEHGPGGGNIQITGSHIRYASAEAAGRYGVFSQLTVVGPNPYAYPVPSHTPARTSGADSAGAEPKGDVAPDEGAPAANDTKTRASAALWFGGDTGGERAFERDLREWVDGGISQEQFGDRVTARGVGAAAGLAIDAAVLGAFFAGAEIAAAARVATTSVGVGAGASGAAFSRLLHFTERTLQKGFTKHGSDFGLSGNWSPIRAAEFSRAVNQHINSLAVRAIVGTYRGNPVIHYLNPQTGLNVIADPAGNYMSGWMLGAQQLQSVLTTGRLF